MIKKDETRLNVGILGCGPIAQFAHFESCQKGRNVNLYAICDVAEDLRLQMQKIWRPEKVYADYDEMLSDPKIDLIILAISDSFHVPMALKAVQAGKHVLVEKPLTHSIGESISLKKESDKAGVLVQVGHMRRFDPGNQFVKEFLDKEAGELIALKAWYGDNAFRYTVTDNIQPTPFTSTHAKKPGFNEKEDKSRYFMMAHGSHLIDLAIYFGGSIDTIRARMIEKAGIFCWLIEAGFETGVIGQLDLSIGIKMDWHEGYQLYCTNGSATGKGHNPWFYKSTDVQCFFADQREYRSPLGEDGFSYRRQLEGFADAILHHTKIQGTSLEEAIEITKAMVAVKQSIELNQAIYLAQLREGEL